MLCNGPINNENESAKRWQTAAHAAAKSSLDHSANPASLLPKLDQQLDTDESKQE